MSFPKKGVIFDLDGTLLDTIEDIADAVNRGIGSFGFSPHTPAEYKQMVGEGIKVLVRKALPAFFKDEAIFPSILAAVQKEYTAGIIIKTRLYPGIPDVLDELAGRLIPMAVLSNKPHDLVTESVRRLFSRWPFRAAVGEQDNRPCKPDPAVSLEIAAILGCLPENIYLVGDSEIDILTAKNAGMIPVAVGWGFRSLEELRRHAPAALINTPMELVRLMSRD